MQVEQGTKHPEAGPWHMFTVVIGYPRNYQIRLIKLIRGSKILNMSLSVNTAEQVHGKEWLKYPSTKTSQEWIDWVRISPPPTYLLPWGYVSGSWTSFTYKFVDQTNVGKRSSRHHSIVTTARSVGVKLSWGQAVWKTMKNNSIIHSVK